MRASTSAWASGDSFGAFEGCCAGSGAATDSGLKRFDGTSEATADAKAARRANSRREIVESLLLPIASSPCLEEEVQKYEWTAKNEATESAFQGPDCIAARSEVPSGVFSRAGLNGQSRREASGRRPV